MHCSKTRVRGSPLHVPAEQVPYRAQVRFKYRTLPLQSRNLAGEAQKAPI